MPRKEWNESDKFQLLQCLGVGVVTLLACIVSALFSPAQFFRSYLPAYQFYLGIALGCMTIVMIYHLTGGAWGFLIRRLLEAGMRTLPLLAILFIPIACGLGYLYLAAAILLGALFIVFAFRLLRSGASRRRTVARGVYLYSMLYLALLFVAIMVDSTLRL